MDVRADECERQLKVAEKERDQWEGKYEVRSPFSIPDLNLTQSRIPIQATEAKYRTAKAELDELVSQMEGL
jgi:exonuclease VII small subunit